MEPTALTKIWDDANKGTSFIADAVHSQAEDSDQDLTKHLGNALVELSKATSAIQNILATRRLS